MPDIYHSKEVLKNAHREGYDDVVVPVYGMYVTGKYSTPYYANPTLTISNITSIKATFHDFTTNSIDHNDNTLNLLDLTFDAVCPDIFNYSSKSLSLPSDHLLNILDITFDSSFDCESYTSDSFTQNDHVLNILDMSFDTDYDVDDITSVYFNNTPEPALRLRTIETTKATITNQS